MDKFNLLDCTLRDGGYITSWKFDEKAIRGLISGLIDANLDFVEVGYLNSKPYQAGTAIFNNIKQIGAFIPVNRKNSTILAMADVTQFKPENVTKYDGTSIDGIRVVFYKHQVHEALELCKVVSDNGYKLFVQPMVTIDYTINEYMELAKEIAKLKPFGVSIVDSFGYMAKADVKKYFKVLDNLLPENVVIGYHSHNNMQLAFITAQDILDYQTSRKVIIDASLYGMGRGAGNLNTELIANYYNLLFGEKFNIQILMDLISEYIMPIRANHVWGYSPYMFLTGLYHVHPNFATYLLESHPEITVSDFEQYIHLIPQEMRTKCRKPYVEELYLQFKSNN